LSCACRRLAGALRFSQFGGNVVKITDIPFNMDFHFDENLREKPVALKEMQDGIQYLQKYLQNQNVPEPLQAKINAVLVFLPGLQVI
jgi:hypothetical protein